MKKPNCTSQPFTGVASRTCRSNGTWGEIIPTECVSKAFPDFQTEVTCNLSYGSIHVYTAAHLCTPMCTHSIHTHVHMHLHTHMHTQYHANAHTYMHTRTRMHTHTHTHTHTHMHTRTHTHTHTHICTHAHTHIYAHTCTHQKGESDVNTISRSVNSCSINVNHLTGDYQRSWFNMTSEVHFIPV